MLWWLIGFWLAPPALLPIFWLLSSVKASFPRQPQTASR